jgi:hypothetical protein
VGDSVRLPDDVTPLDPGTALDELVTDNVAGVADSGVAVGDTGFSAPADGGTATSATRPAPHPIGLVNGGGAADPAAPGEATPIIGGPWPVPAAWVVWVGDPVNIGGDAAGALSIAALFPTNTITLMPAALAGPTISIIDLIPFADSSETTQNSEPSLAVNPLNANQMIAGAFGASTSSNPFWLSTTGGATWADFTTLSHVDKSLAWKADGSAFLAAALQSGGANFNIKTFSATTSSTNFGSAINSFGGGILDLDQPWIRTGPSNHVYVSYNNLSNFGTGKTASINVSSDGGATYTSVVIDQVGGTAVGFTQDMPAVRLAVNGSRVYGVFTRTVTTIENDANGERFAGQVVVVRDDNAGANSFKDLGTLGAGSIVASPITLFANTQNTPLTLGEERTAGDVAIAVDPGNANRVVVAFTNAPGANGSGLLQLMVAESTDGGANWTTKFVTPSSLRAAQPALAILPSGTVGLLYDTYTPGGAVPDADGTLSQHFLETADDFATATDTILATESNLVPSFQFDPYLGDFFDLQGFGSTFYGIFAASNANNGTTAAISNVTYQRNFTGTPGQSSFALKDTSGATTINPSIDPYFFTASDIACFCRGTQILTEAGEVPVEDLKVGDRVVTLSGMSKPIVWIGVARSLVSRANRAVWPIVVKRGALADNVPHRDLYLTHGHSLYLGGVLIPVENLINHRSILWDETARAIEYYHIELDDHDVLFADGAPAESYHEDDNRELIHSEHGERGTTAGKPPFAAVLNGGETVEAVWAQLYERAGGEYPVATTDDPDLHLTIGTLRLDPVESVGAVYTFALPGPPTCTLCLRSRVGVPSLLGITRHDHRRLGVAISRIVLRQQGIVTAFEHDAPLFLQGGAHPAEASYSWTDGALDLPAQLFEHLKGGFTLTVHTERPAMRYPIEASQDEAA